MRRHGITHVLDLTAQNSYRLLIAWERVRAEAKKVLHCFGTQTAGSDFLIPLGFLCREILSKGTEEKITSITPGTYFDTPYEQLLFLSSPRPPANAPQELEAQQSALNMADELGRMRRCIIRIVSALDSSVEQLGESGITSKVRRLARSKLIPSVIETHMLTIIRTRNDVEYGRSLQISESRVQAARAAHSEIKKWAQSRKVPLPNECLEI